MSKETDNLQKVLTETDINLLSMSNALSEAFESFRRLQEQLKIIDAQYYLLYDDIFKIKNIIGCDGL